MKDACCEPTDPDNYFPIGEHFKGDETVHHAVCYVHSRFEHAFMNEETVRYINEWDNDPWRKEWDALTEALSRRRFNWQSNECKQCALSLLNNGPIYHNEFNYQNSSQGRIGCRTVPACCIYEDSIKPYIHPDWKENKEERRRRMTKLHTPGVTVGLYAKTQVV